MFSMSQLVYQMYVSCVKKNFSDHWEKQCSVDTSINRAFITGFLIMKNVSMFIKQFVNIPEKQILP